MKKAAQKKKKKGSRKKADVSVRPKSNASGEAKSGRSPGEAKGKTLQPVATLRYRKLFAFPSARFSGSLLATG